jgi:hypothetical protein
MHVLEHEELTEMILRSRALSIPIEALTIATGLPLKESTPDSLAAQSIALFSSTGTDKSYSGVAIRMASATLIFDLNYYFCTHIMLKILIKGRNVQKD